MRRAVYAGVTLCLSAGPALAEGHGVTVMNGTGETIRSIQISPTPGAGENRLRSQIPPGASGRSGSNTACTASDRLGFESGRSEDHPNVDIWSDPTVIAGREGVGGPAGAPLSSPVAAGPARGTSPLKPLASKVQLAPPPIVPPWTGKSITKRFGGMD